jgi:PAS domain S-box-containing protein
MAKKPTYEELEQRVKELEKESAKRISTEKVLKESEERFRLLYERAPLSYQSLDKMGCIVEVNQAWLDTLGYNREEVIGKSFGNFLHPDWTDHFKENFPRFKAIGEVLGLEFEMVKKDDSNITVSFHGKIGLDIKGEFKQTHCILYNITERKRVEEALQKAHNELESRVQERTAELESTNRQMEKEIKDRKLLEQELKEREEKYSNLFHFSNDGIFLHDLEGNILDINQKALDQFEYTKSEMLSFKIPDFHPPEALEKSKWAFETIIREGFISFETDFKKKTGEVFTAEVSSSLFEIGDKKVIQGIVRDITERKLGEKEREKLITELQEALKEIKTLRGILPLCSFCKKIRDDKGYWESVDVYIDKHSQADISHSICPDCAKEHYPDYELFDD